MSKHEVEGVGRDEGEGSLWVGRWLCYIMTMYTQDVHVCEHLWIMYTHMKVFTELRREFDVHVYNTMLTAGVTVVKLSM